MMSDGSSGATLRLVATLAVLLAATAPAACGPRPANEEGDSTEMAARSIEEVLRDSTRTWMAIPGVVGTGIGECEGAPCIRVMVARRTPEILERLPEEVEGYRIDVIETGPFRARESE